VQTKVMVFSSLFGAKTFGFFEIFDVLTDKGRERLNTCGHFVEKGGGGYNFSWFCNASSMEVCLRLIRFSEI